MPWFKIAAIGAGILIAFLIVTSVISTVLGLAVKLVIAAALVGGIVVAVKMARSRRQVSGRKAGREVREPDYQQRSRPLPRADVEPMSTTPQPPRPSAQDVDDELARLKREMGG